MFKDLRSGSIVYILDNRETPRYYTATLKAVSEPYTPQPQLGQYPPIVQQYVNITIDNEPWGVPINLETVSKNGLTVSCTREGLMSEVNSMYRTTMEAINSFDKQKENAKAYEQILRDLDPAYAKTKAQDEKIESLQSEISSMSANMKALLEIMSKPRGASAPVPAASAASASSKTTSKTESK